MSLLDRVVTVMYRGAGPEQQRAQRVLSQLQEHPDAWQRVDRILEAGPSAATRYYALQILDRLVQTRWNALPREQAEGIKNYVVGLIIRTSDSEAIVQGERVYLNKLNLLLVQILKHEWPRHWPNFISELVGAGRTSQGLCENNMVILKLLSEEVFDYSAEQMTTLKARSLKQQLCGEFAEVFQLCSEVLEHASRPSLLQATLEALLRFLRWIPLGYIFETNLIDEILIRRYLPSPQYRNTALGCLTEIAALQVGGEYDSRFVALWEGAIGCLSSSPGLPFLAPASLNSLSSVDMTRVWEDAGDAEQKFLQNLAIFLSTCLGGHLRALEKGASSDSVLLGHLMLLRLSKIDDREVFKVCLEYWTKLVSGLYAESPYPLAVDSLLLRGSPMGASQSPSRRARYGPVCSILRQVMIGAMVKPEEVLIVEDENGNIVREQIKETDTITLYKAMREVLVFLTHLDVDDTERVMTEHLSRQIDGSEWSWANLNKLCWAVGSVSGAMNEETEKRFLVTVVRDLLGLVEMKRGKDNKAVVAANIMYVVGQYPRFLKAHWKFLKTVINKLFEFMHEMHEGVQDMACDTFLKIVRKCRRQFVFVQPGEPHPFIEDILERLPGIICDLQPGQVHAFYRAMGAMLEADPDPSQQQRHLLALMSLPNDSWDTIISAASAPGSNPSAVLSDNPETLKTLSNILKTNVATCSAAGPAAFLHQLSRIFLDALSVYRTVSGLVSEAVARQGALATRTPVTRAMRTVKKDVLRLMQTYVEGLDSEQQGLQLRKQFSESFAPPLFEAILVDYRQNADAARDAEVLSLTAAIIDKLGELVEQQIGPVLETVFEPTLSMISKDLSDFPEHRAAFFKLLRAVNVKCFTALLRLPPGRFKLTMDSVVWAFKHSHRDIAETGLLICAELLDNIERQGDPGLAGQFYKAFYCQLVQDLVVVLTDSDQRAGFKVQAALLAHLFKVLPTLPISLDDASQDNKVFVAGFVKSLLASTLPHLQQYRSTILGHRLTKQSCRAQIDTFVKGLFDLNCNPDTFRAHLHDFLIALKQYGGGEDAATQFLEEAALEEERKRQAEAEAAARAAVPGMLKPAELRDEDDEYEDVSVVAKSSFAAVDDD